MRILQINSHYNQGGAARIVACIHRQLRSDGQESYVAYGRGVKTGEEFTYRFDTGADIYLSALASRIVGLNGWFNRLATRRLLRYIDQVQPDILHLHALHGYYLNFPMLFSYINKHKLPCVWTFHDCHAFVGNCGYYFDCGKWKTGCGHCPRRRGYPASQFFDLTEYMWKRKKAMFTGEAPKIIVTPSDWLTEQASYSFFRRYPCVTIHNGIDAKHIFYPRNRRVCREKYGYGIEEKLVLGIAVGYRDPRKGAKYIIQAARNLGDEAKVILIGWRESDNGLLQGTDNIVTLPGTGDVDVLAEYYSMADVFVLPSLAENYATVTLESMACGTPVVGFDTGGIPEQLTEGKGIAVPTGDQEAFDRAIRQALAPDSGLLRGEELAEKIRQDNSTEKMVEEYMKIYDRLLRERETAIENNVHAAKKEKE